MNEVPVPLPASSAEDGLALDPSRRRDVRVAVEQSVSLQFESFKDFVSEVSTNISVEGMLINTGDPKPPGTVFDFELTIGGDVTLIEGSAEVVWVRSDADGEGRPPGMGVRFLELNESSRSYVQRVVDLHLESGAYVFELGRDGPLEDRNGENHSDADGSGAHENGRFLVDRPKVSEAALGGSSLDWDNARDLAENAQSGSSVDRDDAEDVEDSAQQTRHGSSIDWDGVGDLAADAERGSAVDWHDVEDSSAEPPREDDRTPAVEADATVATENAESTSRSVKDARSSGAPWRGSWSRC